MNQIYTLSQLQQAFPNKPADQVEETVFLDVHDDDSEFDEHPVIKLLKEQVVAEIAVINTWQDDHLFCCLLEIKFVGDQETYFLPLWWFDPTYLLLAGQALGNIEKGREFAAIFDED